MSCVTPHYMYIVVFFSTYHRKLGCVKTFWSCVIYFLLTLSVNQSNQQLTTSQKTECSHDEMKDKLPQFHQLSFWFTK